MTMVRKLYLAGGLLFVALGAVGAVLPIMPTVPFLLVAVFCFARSNPSFERRILDHPVWGPQVRDWTERRAIGRRAKILAITAMAIGVGFTWAALGAPYHYVSIAILLIAGTWIATRNE